MRTVEVFADVVCPFTHVGLRTLVDRRGNRGLTEPRLRIRAWPLELINGKPLDSHHVGAEILAVRASVCPDLFAGFSVDTFPGTSMAAFALTAAADRVGDPVLIEEVGMALRSALIGQHPSPTDSAEWIRACMAGAASTTALRKVSILLLA